MKIKHIIIGIIAAAISCNVNAQNKINRPTSYNYQRGVEAMQNEEFDEALDFLNKEIKDNPKNGYAYAWIAMIRDQQEEYGRALTSADLAIKNLPKKDAEYVYFAYEIRANVYAELEDTTKAVADYTTAIQVMPDNDDAYEKRAQIYYEQKKFDLADADYRKLISLNQGSVMGYMGLGRNRNAQKLWNEAIEQFDYVTKLHSDYSSAYSFRAESYIGLENWDKATDDIMTALKIDSDDKAFYMMQHLDDEPFIRLKAKMQVQAAKEANDEKWQYYLGIIHEQKGKPEQAVKYYEEANRINMSAFILERIANCYEKAGQYENCLVTLDNALNMAPEKHSLLSLKANVLYETGRISDAIKAWDEVLAKYPDYAWGYYRRGWIKDNAKDIDGAIEDYTMSITLDPEYTYAYQSRAEIYSKQGRKSLADADNKKIIELEPDPDSYEVSHYAYHALGNDAKAIEIVEAIIARDTTDAGSYYDAACLYSRMNRKNEAMEYLKKAFEHGYKRFAHIEVDYDMDILRDLPEFKELISKYKEEFKEQEPLATSVSADSSNTEVVEVPFTKESGSNLCNVKCTINDLPLYFIFDTGASDVSLSQVEATFMMKNGYLSKQDVVGNAYFSDAVGNVNVGTVINLKKVDFGGLELTNVKASVVKNQKAPLLLGQSVLGRLGKIEIDNGRNVLIISNK